MRLVRRLTLAGVALGIVAAGAGGCIKAPESPTKTPVFTKIDLKVGDGEEAVSGSVVTVSYIGWLYDPAKSDFKGGVFDSSYKQGSTFTFTLGAGQVIKGWDEGLVGMKVGGLRRLILPPPYGYGGVRVTNVPAEATLLFEVELVSIEPATSS